ncbi:MAG TPA: hypothetical protein VLH86_02690 [Patescibacteria group bacterium]|nr:hypothetical protein [Patescibacteria group bacterium]
MTTATLDILADNTEVTDSRRTRIAKSLGLHAVGRVFGRAGTKVKNFTGEHKAALFTGLGTALMLTGLAAAAAGLAKAAEVTAGNLQASASAALMPTEDMPATVAAKSHSAQEGELGGGGLAVLVLGGGLTARGLRTRRLREQASVQHRDWATMRPSYVGATMVDVGYSPGFHGLDEMLSAPYHPHPQERFESRCATAIAGLRGRYQQAVAAREELVAQAAANYNGFDTGFVAGAPDLNVLAGLTA